MNQALLERYRCPEHFLQSRLAAPLSGDSRFFRFVDILCYGRCSSSPAERVDPGFDSGQLLLPFDPTEIVDNLRWERYTSPGAPASLVKHLYYLIRPFLPTYLRSHLQRRYLRGWKDIAFPRWPLDVTVERLLEEMLLCFMRASGVVAIPFIWFWPDGASSAAIMTHDVETAAGRDYCSRLMQINESFGIRTSFQIVPEERYAVPPHFLDEIRDRGNEINIQDLNHDGRLFQNRSVFESRVKRINSYGRTFGAKGFRAAVLYRNLNWFGSLEFEYDMSVPNIGHVEAQRGGCCTVFPYFIGKILELPVTTTQDYSLFQVVRQYSLDLWKAQAEEVAKRHGLLTFISHPDYLQERRAHDTYCGLLSYLSQRRAEKGVWITTPGEINRWWRERSQMRLVQVDGGWRIEGQGNERARIAYARAENDRLVYS